MEVIMDYDIDIFSRQFPVLNEFTYHFVAYKKLFSHCYNHSLIGNQEFWIRTTDVHLKTSIVSWCMVFGADSNSIHWKKGLSLSKKKLLTDDFRQLIYKECNLENKEWAQYWKSMTDFRNNYISHRTLEDLTPVPFLDKALEIVFCYDTWIRRIIDCDFSDLLPLEKLFIQYSSDIDDTLTSIKLVN